MSGRIDKILWVELITESLESHDTLQKLRQDVGSVINLMKAEIYHPNN